MAKIVGHKFNIQLRQSKILHTKTFSYPLYQGTLSVREDFQYYESHSYNKTGFVEEWPLRSHVWEINNVKKQLCRNEITKVSYITVRQAYPLCDQNLHVLTIDMYKCILTVILRQSFKGHSSTNPVLL
jgi:hypothetical protein